MEPNVDAAIEEGRRLLEALEWEAARDVLGAVLDSGAPEVLDGYGHALWFLGRPEEGLELRQQASLAYGARGDCDRAAGLATWVSHQYLVSGRASLANGWLERAERALEGHADCVGAGWVAVERARRAAPEESAEAAGRAIEIGRRHGDDDLEVFALSLLGRAEIAAGAFDQGMRRLEEAMAAATAGRIRNPQTLGEAYCTLIDASTSAGDWERASEWLAIVDDFATSGDILPLHGACRTMHADVLVASGRWGEAEASLTDALGAHARHFPAMAAPTLATLAQLRVRQGRLAEAEQLLSGRDESGRALRALALLRLAEGEPRVAVALLDRALASAAGDILTAARVLAPLVDAHIACDDVAAARDALLRLEEVSGRSGRTLVRALTDLAAARLASAEGDDAAAHDHANAALRAFTRLGMPHEAAEARVELAVALAARLPELALEEARAALATFRDLGATRSADLAAATVRSLGGGSAPGPRVPGDLTARELQVLALVADGRTNAQIGEALFITEKTAGHHVSRILQKLGARNRVEAASHAARLGATGPAASA